MKVNRFSEVAKYDPPNHFDCTALRLQGWDASDTEGFWVGLSHFLPGGGTTHEGTPLEKVYVVVRGEVTVVTDETEATLAPYDSCHIPAGRGPHDRQPHERRGLDDRRHALPGGQPVTTLPRPASVFDLTGRSAVVTGATGAFGEQAAYALAGAGAHVTLAGANTEKLQAVAQAIADAGGAATTVAAATGDGGGRRRDRGLGGRGGRRSRHRRGRLRDQHPEPRSSTRTRPTGTP